MHSHFKMAMSKDMKNIHYTKPSYGRGRKSQSLRDIISPFSYVKVRHSTCYRLKVVSSGRLNGKYFLFSSACGLYVFHISYNKYIFTFIIWKEHSWEMAKFGGREGEPSTDLWSPFNPCAGWKRQNQVAGRSSSSLPPAARSPHRLCFSHFSSAQGAGPLVLPSSLLQKSPASVLLVHLPSWNNKPSLLSCLLLFPFQSRSPPNGFSLSLPNCCMLVH